MDNNREIRSSEPSTPSVKTSKFLHFYNLYNHLNIILLNGWFCAFSLSKFAQNLPFSSITIHRHLNTHPKWKTSFSFFYYSKQDSFTHKTRRRRFVDKWRSLRQSLLFKMIFRFIIIMKMPFKTSYYFIKIQKSL